MNDEQVVELPAQGDMAFAALMDALAPEEAAAGTGGEAGAGPGPGGQAAAPAADVAPAGGGGDATAGRAPGAEDGQPGGAAPEAPPGDAGAADGGADLVATTAGEGDQGADRPAAWTAEAAAVIPRFGDLSNAIEKNLVQGYRAHAYDQTRQEFGRYFEALETHPRMLVGKEVPSMTGEGMERLKSTEDARDWQEAVKETLVKEIENRASVWMQDAVGFVETIHASVDLFKNNPDLIPGTKGFDRKLADSFAEMAKPYEVRIDGKLHGYSIPVQPIIDNLRKKSAGTKVAQPPVATPAAARHAAEPPQAGITSKTPTGSEREDFSTLFGTIGLPHLKI